MDTALLRGSGTLADGNDADSSDIDGNEIDSNDIASNERGAVVKAHDDTPRCSDIDDESRHCPNNERLHQKTHREIQ
ncbi:hypothetical protein [Chromohalobacter israelensis]|uniref:hypothetical protein n=1 Tax=Chromohalobacter israelensis TaxID=141390 RepID=UPI0015C46821|nr:hypothetical protein [Chromohalobacter salexigens]